LPVVDTGMHISDVVVLPDGQRIITNDNHCVCMWELATGRELRRWFADEALFFNDRRAIVDLHVVNHGRAFVTLEYKGDKGRRMLVQDIGTNTELRPLDLQNQRMLAISPDGTKAALSRDGLGIVLIDMTTGKDLRTIWQPPANLKAFSAAFSPDGGRLIVCASDQEVRVWEVADGSLAKQFASNRPFPSFPFEDGGFAATISPDGRRVALWDKGKYIAIHDLTTGQFLRGVAGLAESTQAVAWSPDCKTLAWTGRIDFGRVRLMEVASGSERHRFVGHRGYVRSLAFSADGTRLVTGGDDTTALVWDMTGRYWSHSPWSDKLARAELEQCWADLASEDPALAFQATRRLAAAPADAVPYLEAKLPPVAVVEERRLARLVAALDSDSFAARRAATQELEGIAEAAGDYLRKVLAGNPSPELRMRAWGILDKQLKAWLNPGPENLRVLRTLETMEFIGTPGARQILQRWAGGAPGAKETEEAKAALGRLGKRA
jgi:WD40 repeat protein